MKKIVILGASGYIGLRLSKILSSPSFKESELHLFNRNKRKLEFLRSRRVHLHDIELSWENREKIAKIIQGADVLFYLVHSMSSGVEDFEEKERQLAKLVAKTAKSARIRKIIYLGGLGEGSTLSKHLRSRQGTGELLRKFHPNVIELRAGIIIGAGGSSFEIVRTLATKLPVIPSFWKKEGRVEPVFVDDVLEIMIEAAEAEESGSRVYDLGCGQTPTYSELVRLYAREVIGRKVSVLRLPFLEKVFTPPVIGWIISFMTGQPRDLVIPLIYGVKNDAVTRKAFRYLYPYKKLLPALKLAAQRERSGSVLSVWDFPSTRSNLGKKRVFTTMEKEGLLYEEVVLPVQGMEEDVFREVKKIGGKYGYWSPYWIWWLRGLIDRALGGLGLNPDDFREGEDLHIGDRIDFWVVEFLKDTPKEKVLRLRSEMITPGEAWLQFTIKDGKFALRAFFEPSGPMGYLYWYSLYIIHKFIFRMMATEIVKRSGKNP